MSTFTEILANDQATYQQKLKAILDARAEIEEAKALLDDLKALQTQIVEQSEASEGYDNHGKLKGYKLTDGALTVAVNSPSRTKKLKRGVTLATIQADHPDWTTEDLLASSVLALSAPKLVTFAGTNGADAYVTTSIGTRASKITWKD